MTKSHDIGDLRRIPAAFTDFDGVATDPTEATIVIREPDGAIVTDNTAGAVVNDAAADGAFYYDFTITKAGRHVARWEGTGAVVTAGEVEFYARRKEAVAWP